MVASFWFLFSGFWIWVSYLRFMGSGFWLLVSESWILDSGFWCLASGFCLLRLGEPAGGCRGNRAGRSPPVLCKNMSKNPLGKPSLGIKTMKMCQKFEPRFLGHVQWSSKHLNGNRLWISCMGIVYGNRVWKSCVEIVYGNVLWKFCMEVMCGNYVWKSCMEICYGSLAWKCCMKIVYGNFVWKLCMEAGGQSW